MRYVSFSWTPFRTTISNVSRKILYHVFQLTGPLMHVIKVQQRVYANE